MTEQGAHAAAGHTHTNNPALQSLTCTRTSDPRLHQEGFLNGIYLALRLKKLLCCMFLDPSEYHLKVFSFSSRKQKEEIH